MREPTLSVGLAAALFLFAVGLTVSAAWGLHPAVRHYRSSDGLPQAQIYAVVQDVAGFLWVGTYAGGVARYDGHRWRVMDTGSGLPSASVLGLAVSPDGTVFAATTGGAARLVGQRWRPLPVIDEIGDRIVETVLPLGGEELLIGTGSGLVLWRGDDRPLQSAVAEPPLAGVRVIALAQDEQGRLWAGTAQGLAEVELGARPSLRAVAGLPEGAVVAIAAMGEDGLAVALGGHGIYLGRDGAFENLGDERLPGKLIWAVHPSSSRPGCLWVATEDHGALRWCDGEWETFGVTGEGAPGTAFSIFEDREGVLWIGTDDGLVKHAPSAFMTYDTAEGMPTRDASFGMVETEDGSVCFGFWGSGVSCLRRDGTVDHFATGEGLEDTYVSSVAAARDGGVWVFSQAGLGQIRAGRFRKVPLPDGVPVDLSGGLEAADGRLYLTAFSGGLFVLEDGRVRRVGEPVGVMVNSLSHAVDGAVWCCGEGWGAVRLRDGRPELQLTTADGLPSDYVTFVLEDSAGALWVATDRGVWRRDPDGQAAVLDDPSGPGSSYVYWVQELPAGSFWFGTNRGVHRRDPDHLWGHFTAKDGLGADECNQNGVLVDSQGRLFVSTSGVSLFVGADQSPQVPPQVCVDTVRTSGETLSGGGSVSVAADSGPVTFSFVCPSFVDETGTRFRYRLVGLSDAWTAAEAGEYATTYGGLSHGDYRFEVEATTSDGRVSATPASVVLIVTPVWWQRPVARIAGLALLLLLALAVVRWRERRFARVQRRLERLVAERTEELRETNRRLEELAVTDELTGLPNRRSVLDSLRRMLAYARRHRDPLAVTVIDVDYFKAVNDELGHEAGDRVLRGVAQVMLMALREQDRLGRYGGDEFLAVLPGTTTDGALSACERVRKAVADSLGATLELERDITVSIGVASYEGSDTVEEIIRRADEALYRSKASGRNTVVLAD